MVSPAAAAAASAVQSHGMVQGSRGVCYVRYMRTTPSPPGPRG